MSSLILEDLPEQFQWINKLEERVPPFNSLFNICARYVSSNLDKTLFEKDSDSQNDGMSDKWGEPKNGVFLPLVVSQAIFDSIPFGERGYKNSLAAFASSLKPNPLPLTSIDLSGSGDINDWVLEQYLKASSSTLLSLNISKCHSLSNASLGLINKYCKGLKSLVVGTFTQILYFPYSCNLCNIIYGNVLKGLKELEKLVIHDMVKGSESSTIFSIFLFDYNLSFLDLSGCYMQDFEFLTSLSGLKSLLLYDVQLEHELGSFYSVVGRLSKKITHLDISLPKSKASTWGTFENPDNLLEAVVVALENLTSLDISGTNLAGDGVTQFPNCDIQGLNSRLKRPLEYLGLYCCAQDASHRTCIPAKLIGGDEDECQLINAARAFIDRPEMLQEILKDLQNIIVIKLGRKNLNMKECLLLILLVMRRHPGEVNIQLLGLANLNYIVKNDKSYKAVKGLKSRILLTIDEVLETHSRNPRMILIGYSTLNFITITEDMFLYEKMVKIFLNTLIPGNNEDSFNELLAVYQLSCLADEVEGEQKRLLGDLKTIEIMLDFIRGRLNRGNYDVVMEMGWRVLWNLAEMPENSNKFLQNDGLDLFLQCFQFLSNELKLLHNMMGVLWVVAAVAQLRPQLMTAPLISIFYEQLNSSSTQDNFEVSYQAAGVLAHILSDGEAAWVGLNLPTRPRVCQRLRATIEKWDVDTPEFIFYRTLKSIFPLLLVSHTVEVCLWAAWTLAKLTNTHPGEYVGLLKDEGGMEILQNLETSNGDDLGRYVCIVVDNVKKYNLKPDLKQE